jgi:RNA polymerase sigma-70 factor (ECF subfamily)
VTVAVADLLTLPSDESLTPGAPAAPLTRESPEARALLDRARAGDAEAFGRLVAMHQSAVFRAAVAALGSHADAEDAAQDAFVMAWRKLPGFRGEAQFRTWLLTIVWRKALDRRRRRTRWSLRVAQPAGTLDNEAPDPLAGLAERSADPERVTIASDAARRVRQEIRQLTPKLRDTLLLAASGDHTYEEIAAMLGVPLGTVKWRVAEARRMLTARCDGSRS